MSEFRDRIKNILFEYYGINCDGDDSVDEIIALCRQEEIDALRGASMMSESEAIKAIE